MAAGHGWITAARSLLGQRSCGTAGTSAPTPDHTLFKWHTYGRSNSETLKTLFTEAGPAWSSGVQHHQLLCSQFVYIFAPAFGQLSGNWTLFSSPNAFPLHQLPTVGSPSCSPGVYAAQLMLGCRWCGKPACRCIGGWSTVLPGSCVQYVGLPLGGATARLIPSAQHRAQAGNRYRCSCFPWCPSRAAGVILKVPPGAWVMSWECFM